MTENRKISKVYYSPSGYWRGKSAINKLATAAKVSHELAKDWLSKQAIWQIYLPPPTSINYGSFDVSVVNEVHQADILYLPHDRTASSSNVYKYALTIVDVASRYKDAEPLSTKSSSEVASAFKKIYQRVLRWPKLLQVDPGSEFRGDVASLMKKNNVIIRQGHTAIHRDQAIVERFNRTLADKLFGYQYAKEFIQQDRSREWVKRLPAVIKSINEISSQKKKIQPRRVNNSNEIPWNSTVRYLYEPGELEGGGRRSTDPIWSITAHKIYSMVTSNFRPTYYKLDFTAPKRSFTREQLQVIPDDIQLPPASLT